MAKRRTKKRLPLIIAENEASAFIKAAKSPRDKLLVYVGIFLGLRVSELSQLTVRDIDLNRDMLFVREGKGNKDRALPLHSKVKLLLAREIEGKKASDPIFTSRKGGAMKPRAIQLLMKRLVKAAGLEDEDRPRHFTPHKLRHYFATKLIEAGVPITEVSELMGHSNIATTQVYLHVNPARLKSAVDKLKMPETDQFTLFE